ncbi:MAG TPA: tripartite tricarboxylate transporter substrate binding protein, partial [Burkholderiales bacterium]|nr:tripartite tricarboxylate transporter substrate binding protein [Burkholderiales bacterium]
PLKILVGFAPGGPADVLARIAAQILAEGLGKPVTVENRPGAGGTIATSAAAKATPDGYTLLAAATSDVINPLVNKQVHYNIETDFTPIALVASAPNVLVVHPSVPVRSTQELVEYGRAHPGILNYGSAGVGTVSHLAGALVAEAAHGQVVHVPYKGTAAAQADLLSGRLQFMFDSIISALANAKAGKVKALAVTSPERWHSALELPTMAESGFPGFNMTAWFGLLAPAGTPAPIVSRISEVLSKGLQSIEVRDRIAAIGAEAGRMTPAEFGQYIHAENARWKKLFADGLIRIEE